MNTFANAIKNNATTTRTENGDLTYSTSLDANVDLFFKIAAIRGRGASTAVDLFMKAYKQDAEIASRVLLWSRDVREGAGERQTFRDILASLEYTDTDRLMRLIRVVPEIGRWDDLFVLKSEKARTVIIEMMAEALKNGNGLAAKWMPRERKKNLRWLYNGVREKMNLDVGQFRRMIAYLSSTVEQQMCANEWDEIDFSKVPSVASARYSKAFWRRQTERYGQFIEAVTKGEDKSVKINTKALFPYDVTKNSVDEKTQNALWKNLPDYVPGDASFMPLIDLSESMTSMVGSSGITCKDAAIALGIYLAERNKSAFKNLALAFADNPSWISIPETDSVRSKVQAVKRGQIGYSTNLDAAMNKILDTATKNRVSQKDMPKFLLVLSDMEFNSRYGSNATAAQRTKAAFNAAGYEVPTIVWWNIQSRGNTTPVRFDERGMVLVSGLSPSVTKSVLSADVDPKKAMLNTVLNSRYDH